MQRVPKLSIYNEMGFVEQPPELTLYSMEERLVEFKIPFMQIRDLPCGWQKLVHRNIVNMSLDTAQTVNVLPRNMSSTDAYKI